MRYNYGAAALALVSTSSFVFAQDCPAGFAKSNSTSKIDWVNCPTEDNASLQCGTLDVPLDYTNPSGDKLVLKLVRQPAAPGTVNPKSIITNPGGPGESGVKDVTGGGSGYQSLLGNNFHIIGLDPRGVGVTIPYKCPELKTVAVVDYSTDGGITNAYNANKAQAEACADPKYDSVDIGTTFVARDIKAIAESIGEDGLIRYYGYSYGTLLGATLAAMFPLQVDRVVLDGNINPTDYWVGLGEEGAADFDGAVGRFFEQCADAGLPACAVAEAGKDGKALLKGLDDFLAPLSYRQQRIVREGFSDILYFRGSNSWKNFAQTLKGYYDDPDTIDRDDPEDSTEATPQALNGISCGDFVTRWQGSPQNFKNWLPVYQKTSKYGGDIAINLLYQCSTWQANAKEKFLGSFKSIKTRTPVLFVNTLYDPVTPLISAQNSSAGFIDSRVLRSAGVGHCSNANASPELDEAIKTYMQNGSFPKVDVLYQPKVKNVFSGSTTKRAILGPAVRYHNIEYPAYFRNKRDIIKRADATPTNIPAGCTPIAATSLPSSVASSASISGSITRSASSAQITPSSATVLSQPSRSGSFGNSNRTVSSNSTIPYYGGVDYPRTSSSTKPSSTPSVNNYGYDSYKPSSANGYGGYSPSSTSIQSQAGYGGYSPASTSIRSQAGYSSPSTTVYTAKIVDVCSTGLTTSTVTITQACNGGCVSRPTGVPTGYTTTVKYCGACATPSTVTVTVRVTPTPGIVRPPTSTPGRLTGTPARISSTTPRVSSVPPRVSSQPGYGSQIISKPGGGASAASGTPARASTSVGGYPSVPPTVGTSTRVTSVLVGTGTPRGTPTSSRSIIQFTGAAARENVGRSVVGIAAGVAGLAFAL